MAHRRLHGTEHQNGGVDEINVGDLSGVLADRQDANKLQGRDVQDVSPSDDDVLTWNNSESRWEPAAPTGGGGTFGSEFQQVESDGESSTSGTSWVEKVSLTTGSVPAGTYRIGWSFEMRTDSSSMTGYARIQVDDTDTVGDMAVRIAPTTGWAMLSGFKYITLSASSHDIDLDYTSSPNGNKTSYIRRARLELWRVS